MHGGGPILQGLAKVISVIKEPLGKKKLAELKDEIASSLEQAKQLLEAHEVRVTELEAKNLALKQHLTEILEYINLPFYQMLNPGVKANDGAIKMSLKHTTAAGK